DEDDELIIDHNPTLPPVAVVDKAPPTKTRRKTHQQRSKGSRHFLHQ
ncbi:unnamed protein product, partial [Rotaria sp. Silwood2]